MYLFSKRIEDLDSNDIDRLLVHNIPENKQLDYKKELKLSQDKDRKEFLFDITSMANTDGGCLIYGIEERKDENGQNTGTPDKIVGINIENNDKIIQQIEDLIKGNTDPSISNIGIKILDVDNKKVLIIGLQKSLGLPIMVTFNETNKFYKRRNSGKYPVDVYELNQMFMQNQVLKEKAESFIIQRISKIKDGKVFPNISILQKLIIHIIPFNFLNEQSIDISYASEIGLSLKMPPIFSRGYNMIFTLDGYSTYYSDNRTHITSYDLLLRNGVYEIFTTQMFNYYTISFEKENKLGMNGDQFIPIVLKKINDSFIVFKEFQIEPPFIISINLIGIKGAIIYNKGYFGESFIHNEINLPSIIIQNFETNIYEVLKPNFDILWQAVGVSQSPKLIN